MSTSVHLAKPTAYRLLNQMEEDGWVMFYEEQESNRPTRRVFFITPLASVPGSVHPCGISKYYLRGVLFYCCAIANQRNFPKVCCRLLYYPTRAASAGIFPRCQGQAPTVISRR
jgi:hypothetical protein